MPRYIAGHRYSAKRDGQQFGPWEAGREVEIAESDADWVNRDSPGTLVVGDETHAPDSDLPDQIIDGEPLEAVEAGDAISDPDGEEADVVPDGTAQIVLAWVAEVSGREAARARLALDAEHAKGDAARSTLVGALERLAGQRAAVPTRDRMHRDGQNRAAAV